MSFDFNSGTSFLSLKKPMKAIKMVAPEADKIYLHSGENPVQYQSFIEAMNNLAQALKFMPKYDQMKYQYGDPFQLLSKNDAAINEYIDALIEFEPDQGAKNDIISARQIMFDATKSVSERHDAYEKIKAYSNNPAFGNYSKQQASPTSTTDFLSGKSGTSVYSLKDSLLVEGSETVSLWDNTDQQWVPQTNGTDYTISYLTGEITFLKPLDDSSSIKADYQYGTMLGQGLGVGFTNFHFSPEASDWNLIDGVTDAGDSSILDDINNYFNWDDIKSVGGGQSYYELAKGGLPDIDTFDAEQAFDLMCSMLDARERVFSAYKSIFGDPADLNDNEAVIENISNWLEQYTDVDPHNMGILKMFFSMQTDFINTVDAYANCQTFWGGDLTTPASGDLVTFSDDLMSRVDSYIFSLTGEKKTAAEDLESMWMTKSARWDQAQVDGQTKWTGDIMKDASVDSDTNWVKFFMDRMNDAGNKEVVRVILADIMNRTQTTKYNAEEADYENKKDDLIQDEINLRKIEAKNKAESRKLLNSLIARSKKSSAVSRSKGRKTSGVSGAKHAPAVHHAAAPKHVAPLVAGHAAAPKAPVTMHAPVAAHRPVVSVAAAAAGIKQQPKPKKGHSEEKKVV